MNWLYRFDLEGFRAIHVGLHAPWLDPVFAAITYTGLSSVQIPFALLFGVWKETRSYVLPLLFAILTSGVPVAQGLKALILRDRPSQLPFAHAQEDWHFNSFPSGHTSTAFGIAFTLLLLTWDTPRARYGWLAIAWACLVGVSRVYRGVHWPTDALAGMFGGLFSACLVWSVWVRLQGVTPTRREVPSP